MVSQETVREKRREAALARMGRQEAAAAAKQENIRLLGTLLAAETLTPEQTLSWFQTIDRTRSLAAQVALTETLRQWAKVGPEKAKAAEVQAKKEADEATEAERLQRIQENLAAVAETQAKQSAVYTELGADYIRRKAGL